ncbi:TPA: ScpA family protein [Streptococcus suis]
MSKPELKLELQAFQGPFDLLLHLIKVMEVDINDIPMTQITQQYLDFIKSMQEMALDVASEYLVMAATLLEIKARMLLPIEPTGEIEEDYQGDPREILVQQLLVYQQFQEVTQVLAQKEANRARHFGRPMEDLSRFQVHLPLKEGELSLADLAYQFQIALQRELERAPLSRQIEHEPMTIAQKVSQIQARLKNKTQPILMEELLDQPTRAEIITTFMAVLELVRKQKAQFWQDKVLGPIKIALV